MNAIAVNDPTLRLTPKQVKKCWEDGYYTARGYLAHLLLSLKKAGWPVQLNSVKSFCEEWGIKRAAFYRAKAELAASGILTEKIFGRVDLVMSDIPIETEIAGLLAQSSDSKSDFSDRFSQISDPTSQISENQALKTVRGNVSSDLPTLDLLSINSSSERNSAVAQMQQATQTSGQGFGVKLTEEVKPLPAHRESSALNFDDRMRGNLHPWQNSARRNDYSSVFLEYLRDVYLPTTPMYEKKKPTIHHAKSWLTQRSFDEKGIALVELQWQQFQESLTPTAANDAAAREHEYQVKLARAHAKNAAERDFHENSTLTLVQSKRAWAEMPAEECELIWQKYYVHPAPAA